MSARKAKSKLRDVCSVHLPTGLLGGNFLSLLELAKRNVLQPGAAVVPCGATVYVMGLNVSTSSVAGYDLTGLDSYRFAPAPQVYACHKPQSL